MTAERFHKDWGTPLSEWITLVKGELPQDGVFLQQPVADGIEGFGLDGAELDDFVRRCIVELLDAGAVPAMAGSTEPLPNYVGSSTDVASQIVQDWRRGAIMADRDGIWFVLPRRPNE